LWELWFSHWPEFEELVERLIFSKSILSIKDLWWNIRPNLEYGTIEVRIADCPPTIREVEAIVALTHSLAVFIDAEIESGRRFSAPPEWRVLRISLESTFQKFGYDHFCDFLETVILQGPSYHRQRMFAQDGLEGTCC
jgi:gamma-glutamyl:cysteine ligase YbdK (ATP-grasp superfamily)